MLEELKQAVCRANLRLVEEDLVIQTWGNVSGLARDEGLIVIKPSGISYDGMSPDQMVVVSLEDGAVVEGDLRPSSDTPTHLALYRAFEGIGGVVHTHSIFATAWAQARRDLPALGTTHADQFYGSIPCTRPMTKAEIEGDYEANTGKVIIERFEHLDPLQMPAVLVANHGPFTWGRTAEEAVDSSVYLEHIARMASETIRLNPDAAPIAQELLDKHFLRKHGPGKYYGQD
ncbi:MAG: L-ribulose-5-phosphate 4-epimerase [Armatimonadota bacterium]|nr:MAG: L-ribulose-5-phosphate 4-epimerase [Armatimonadota bacterium]